MGTKFIQIKVQYKTKTSVGIVMKYYRSPKPGSMSSPWNERLAVDPPSSKQPQVRPRTNCGRRPQVRPCTLPGAGRGDFHKAILHFKRQVRIRFIRHERWQR